MPTYEYACRDCAQHVEVVQSFTDAPLTSCGVCGGQLRKVFSAAGIIFKGSGYYVTDTRGAGRKGDGKSGDAKSSEGKSKDGDGKGKSNDGGSAATSAGDAKSAPASADSASTSSTPEAKSA